MSVKSVSDTIEAEILYLVRILGRLEEGFLLEKEEALKGDLESITVFRDRCRSHYQIKVEQVRTRLSQLRYWAARAGISSGEMDERIRNAEKRCIEAIAQYSGTPNRLVRIMKHSRKEEKDQ